MKREMKYNAPQESGARKVLDLQFSEETDGKRKKVKSFRLDSAVQAAEYEDLLNREGVTILKEKFANGQSGNTVITVWWEE